MGKGKVQYFIDEATILFVHIQVKLNLLFELSLSLSLPLDLSPLLEELALPSSYPNIGNPIIFRDAVPQVGILKKG